MLWPMNNSQMNILIEDFMWNCREIRELRGFCVRRLEKKQIKFSIKVLASQKAGFTSEACS